MQSLQWLLLGTSVASGIIWTFVIQDWLLRVVFADFLVGPGMNLQAFVQSVSNPAFSILWAGCISALTIWIASTLASRPKSSAEVRLLQPMWWLAAALLTALGWISLGWFGRRPTEGIPVSEYTVPAGGWILLFGFVIIDVILLFWIPTMLSSPRTYRFVVPGAVKILGSR